MDIHNIQQIAIRQEYLEILDTLTDVRYWRYVEFESAMENLKERISKDHISSAKKPSN